MGEDYIVVEAVLDKEFDLAKYNIRLSRIIMTYRLVSVNKDGELSLGADSGKSSGEPGVSYVETLTGRKKLSNPAES
jgi:hypothetical protein